MPDQLKIEPLPLELKYLHEIFYELYDSEGIKWSEVFYYQKIKGIELDGWEIRVIKAANAACVSWYRDKMKPGKNKNKPNQPKRPAAARRR